MTQERLILRDAVDPFAIPLAGLDAVAGYADGIYQWSSEGWARFPAPIVSLSIVVSARNAGDIIDVEPGNATPADVPGWCDRFNRPGRRAPTAYVNRANWPDVIAAVGRRVVDYWVSTLDGTIAVPVPAGGKPPVAVQNKGTALTGGSYDESVILDPSWIRRSTESNLEKKMQVISNARPDGGTDFYALLSDASVVHLVDSKDSTPIEKDYPPGAWLALMTSGWFAGTAYIRGVGLDRNIWQVTFKPGVDTTWQGPFQVI